jgi:DNA-binding MarR family transcriptional regulator
MDYTELAGQFILNTYLFRKGYHPKNIDETMRGEACIIYVIAQKGGGVLPGEISNEMGISSARTAVALNNLEKKGLITRQMDRSDRRKILVDLTLAGQILVEHHNRTMLESAVRIIEALGERDAKELVRILGKLAAVMPKTPASETK